MAELNNLAPEQPGRFALLGVDKREGVETSGCERIGCDVYVHAAGAQPKHEPKTYL